MATRAREHQPDVAQQIWAPAATCPLPFHLPHTAVEPLSNAPLLPAMIVFSCKSALLPLTLAYLVASEAVAIADPVQLTRPSSIVHSDIGTSSFLIWSILRSSHSRMQNH